MEISKYEVGDFVILSELCQANLGTCESSPLNFRRQPLMHLEQYIPGSQHEC